MNELNDELEDNLPVEKIHEMLAEHNAKSSKTFYYTEEETKELCKKASILIFMNPSAVFEEWWNNVKKQ